MTRLDNDELLKVLLAKPVGQTARRHREPGQRTARIQVNGDKAVAELKTPPGGTTTGEAEKYLAEQGLEPSEWELAGYQRSEWTMPSGAPGEAAKFNFRRLPILRERPPIDELVEAINGYPQRTPPIPPVAGVVAEEHGLIVALGDLQLGKVDGDGPAGTINRALDTIDKATDVLAAQRKRFNIQHVHLAFLGDCIEGYLSQGGANSARTVLTLTEQIRLVRRFMLHAIMRFAEDAATVTAAVVPSNHGQAVRVAGRGVTRYDDDHEVEALLAVADAVALSGKFSNVEFFVPEDDEVTVVVDVAGTVVGHAHGHQWRPNRHMDWWKGQAFGGRLHDADLLLAGHLHHLTVDTDGPRTFIQVPALESESTWWRHKTGTVGSPGIVTAVTSDGVTPVIEVIR